MTACGVWGGGRSKAASPHSHFIKHPGACRNPARPTQSARPRAGPGRGEERRNMRVMSETNGLQGNKTQANGYVVDLPAIDASAVSLAGGKGANLGELSCIEGIRVPAGFCVTTDAFVRA